MAKTPEKQSEGQLLKEKIEAIPMTIEDAAGKLEMSRQALYKHFKKLELSKEFKLLIKDTFGFIIQVTNDNEINKTKTIAEAKDLGYIDYQSVESTKSGNEFIDLGAGNYVMLVPLVGQYAYGGYLNGYADAEYIGELPKHPIVMDKKHKGIYRAFEMRGESMDSGTEDSIKEHDIVVGRLIEKAFWNSRFHLHKYKDYIIVHKEGILVKRIINHDVENGIITIHSINQDQVKYPDDVIYLKDVNQIFNITQVTKVR